MRYVIMANGRGTRWNAHRGITKHLIEFGGETLLRRIVRQVAAADPGSDIVISSANPAYETPGARRHVPVRNELEIDRFVPELIDVPVCFLYGDTLYDDAAIEEIATGPVRELEFFGELSGIIAVRSSAPDTFHAHLERVRSLYLAGEIAECRGWQLYQSYEGLPFGEIRLGPGFRRTMSRSVGFNTPTDLEAFEQWYRKAPATHDRGRL